MQRLSFLILTQLLVSFSVWAQSPHGENLVQDCKSCHSAGSWGYAEKAGFDHEKTGFTLDGRHEELTCVDCHSTLIFEEAKSNCISCHLDVHAGSVGNDCLRCHDTENWLVDEIPELHEQNGFPLLGQHQLADCASCHVSETNLQWNRLGADCVNCHLPDYQSTNSPNHQSAGFSLSCSDCHDIQARSWAGSENFHQFFPLTGGHSIGDCFACHQGSDYKGLSTDCISCHIDDFNATQDPNHKQSGFSTDCTLCHTIEGWSPAGFRDHDAEFFPIYSGIHRGEWNSCVECHTTPGSYKSFSCIDCHEHSNRTAVTREHDEVRNFQYESNACYACHPNGKED